MGHPPFVSRKLGTSELQGGRSVAKELASLVGTSPEMKVKIHGVDVNFTIDSGSQVTTISGEFFNNHLREKLGDLRDASSFLKLRAANGLELPYEGYFVTDVEIFGRVIKQKGILVQTDSSSSVSQTSVGLLGMNFIKEIQEFQDWLTKMTAEQDKRAKDVEGGAVKLAYSTRTCIPAWAATSVRVIGPVCNQFMMVDRLEDPLPGSILLVRTLVDPSNGIYEVRLVNMSQQDVWLPAHTVIGKLCNVERFSRNKFCGGCCKRGCG
jgi:hypothetical protein